MSYGYVALAGKVLAWLAANPGQNALVIVSDSWTGQGVCMAFDDVLERQKRIAVRTEHSVLAGMGRKRWWFADREHHIDPSLAIIGPTDGIYGTRYARAFSLVPLDHLGPTILARVTGEVEVIA